MTSSSSKKRKYIDTNSIIYFKSNKANGNAWLSNFWPFCDAVVRAATPESVQIATATFTVDGVSYLSVEHYFHATKYKDNAKACASRFRCFDLSHPSSLKLMTFNLKILL
jgi:hypothetical protein